MAARRRSFLLPIARAGQVGGGERAFFSSPRVRVSDCYEPSASLSIHGASSQVSLIGLLEVKGTAYTHGDEVKQDEHDTLVSENTITVYHDHYITYHMDLDVDGMNNSFVKSTVTAIRDIDCDTLRRSYWTVREVAEREADGKVDLGASGPPTDLVFVKLGKKTRMGNEVGYQIVPASATAASVLDDDNFPQRRTTYCKKQVQVTPNNRVERIAT
uniref:Amine oxidase n=1 Tax=Oryza brachyantha TaxID=4533 RepID=J3MDF7_ORYBR